MTTTRIQQTRPKTQPADLFLYDSEDSLELIEDFPSIQSARVYGQNWVIKHGEDAYAEITDPEGQRVLDTITYEDAQAYWDALLCECGCGREAVAGLQGCASRECAEKAFMRGMGK
jgi:hypothetical protein